MTKSVFLGLPAHGLLVLSLLGLAGCYAKVEVGDSSADKAIAIDWVEPPCAEPGSAAGYIEGNGFGAKNVTITIGGIEAEVLAATGKDASFVVPEELTPGPIEVVVTNPGGRIATINWVVCGFDCSAIECDDGNTCTADTCDPALEMCVHTPVGDGAACDFEGLPGVCIAGLCEEDPCANIDCEDGDPCTIDSCDPLDGSCSYVNTCGDTDPPELVDFDFNPKSVDVTTGPANVLCEATLTDPSGVDYLICSFRSPSGGQFHNCRANSPTSGDINDGVWSCTVTIPQDAEPGLWDINQLQSRDLVGNIGNYSPSTLLEVISQVADTDPPELVEFDFDPKQVDVTTGPANVLCEATLSDPSGVDYLICSFRSPSGGQFHNCRANSPTSGDINDGVWSCTVTIPQDAEPGLWDINQLQSRDLVGNIGNYSPSTLLEVISQVADTDPPELVEFDFDPKQVDVTTGPANVLCEATLSDPSGVDYLICSFRSPSGGQFHNCRAESPTSGDIYNGVWACTATIPQNAEPGLWDINQLQSRDFVGNIGNYSSPILLDVTSSSGPDTDPPVLTDFDFNPKSVDVSTQSQEVNCSAAVSDSGVGTAEVTCIFWSPSGGQVESCRATAPSSGDTFDGVWSCNVTIPQFAEPGAWYVWSVNTTDGLNARNYRTPELQTLGFPTQLDVISADPDVEAPLLTDFDFNPKSVDVSMQSQEVNCSAAVSDSGVGTAEVTCIFWSPSGGQVESCRATAPSSGDTFDGVWSCNVTIPQFAEPGAWYVWSVNTTDGLNARNYRTPELQTLGFPTQLDVTYGGGSPAP